MKKIVGILTAAAMVASVFAADVAASTKIGAKLFNYGADKTVELLKENNDSHDYANPNITFSIGDDKAGATVKLTTDGAGDAEYDVKNGTETYKAKENGAGLKVRMTTQTIWFKPIDMLKVTVGNFDIALNKEEIKWTESMTGLGGNGYLITVDVSGFTLDAGFEANNGSWFTKKDGEDDPAIKAFFIKGAYAADFGTIGAFVKFNGASAADLSTPEAALKVLAGTPYKNVLMPKDGAISSTMFGASYKNTFDPVTMFVNVVAFMDDEFEWVRPELFAKGNIDAFGFAAFVAPTIMTNSDVKDELDYLDLNSIFCEVVAEVSYNLDPVTVYARFDDVNLLAEDFACELRFGAKGNLGCMGWNAWAQINTAQGDAADKVTFGIPVEFTVNF